MSRQSDGSPAMNDEAVARTPEQVQAEIEDTRAELGDTVEALVAKTDVKSERAAVYSSLLKQSWGVGLVLGPERANLHFQAQSPRRTPARAMDRAPVRAPVPAPVLELLGLAGLFRPAQQF